MCANIGPNVTIFKLYNTLEEDSLKIALHHIELRRPQRPIIPIVDTIELFNMRILSPLSNGINIKHV